MNVSSLLTSTLAFLRESFTENVGLKGLALTFALGLFAFLQGQTDEQQRTIPVPIPPNTATRSADASPARGVTVGNRE